MEVMMFCGGVHCLRITSISNQCCENRCSKLIICEARQAKCASTSIHKAKAIKARRLIFGGDTESGEALWLEASAIAA